MKYQPVVDIRSLTLSTENGTNECNQTNASSSTSTDTTAHTTANTKAKKTKQATASAASSRRPYVRWLVFVMALAFIGNSFYIHAKAYAAQYLLQKAWQKSDREHQHKPWPWFDSLPIAKLILPSLQVEHIVLAGDSGQELAFAPGLHGQAAKPGEAGTVVISAHRDTHFNALQHLNPSEPVLLQDLAGDKYAYQITDIRIVDIEQQQLYLGDRGGLLLITCYPFDSTDANTSLRYVIEAEPVQGSVASQQQLAWNRFDQRIRSQPRHF
ncbi:class GN sortase [Thalassotalea sp. Y01]|uniref:class GN sortase n=1 Tax=Thalassotalea sp. Y01 TaxID=2729613 RepID=UPI00145F10B9|nr:class GN sortase [Thalassotalea sp. Y01]NMP15064.1 class GN sortase [Thalassotalea sp. Y01]